MDLATATDLALAWAGEALEETALGVSAVHEDSGAWLIVLDRLSYLEGRNPWGFLMDAPMLLVDKGAASVRQLPWDEGLATAETMTQRVGADAPTPRSAT